MSAIQQQILSQIYALTENEQRQLIQQLLAKAFRSPDFSIAGSVVELGDLEAGTLEIRRMVNKSLQNTAAQLREDLGESIFIGETRQTRMAQEDVRNILDIVI